jgi:hypothetical protein
VEKIKPNLMNPLEVIPLGRIDLKHFRRLSTKEDSHYYSDPKIDVDWQCCRHAGVIIKVNK